MTNTTYYWAAEQINPETEEIVDVNRFDTLTELIAHTEADPSETYHVALVMDADERYWSYVLDGTMMNYFRDSSGQTGSRIPKRYADEFEASSLSAA